MEEESCIVTSLFFSNQCAILINVIKLIYKIIFPSSPSPFPDFFEEKKQYSEISLSSYYYIKFILHKII